MKNKRNNMKNKPAATHDKTLLHDLYNDIKDRCELNEKNGPKERIGQAFFNHLLMVRPDIAEEIRATDADPFYLTEAKGPVWDNFVKHLEKRWLKNPEAHS